jgi:hypothetical protein
MGGAKGKRLQQLGQPPETLLACPQVTTHSNDLYGSDGKGLEAKLLLLFFLLVVVRVLLVELVRVLNGRAERSLRGRGGMVAGEEVEAGVHPVPLCCVLEVL